MKHDQCDHPATPGARATCRKQHSGAPESVAERPARASRSLTTPRAAKRSDGRTRTIGHEYDLAGIPAAFAPTIRHAWKMGYGVRTGVPFNETERNVVVTSKAGVLTLVWRTAMPFGITAAMFRAKGDSVTRRLTAVTESDFLLEGREYGEVHPKG